MHRGLEIEEAVIRAGQTRMRPIWVTDLTMMAGATAILFDPIFEGMAISLLFGAITSVTLTMLTLPLRCIAARNAFYEKHVPQEEDEALPGQAGAPGAPATEVVQSPRHDAS
jgi:Cu/Ag efflux pump CusA